jgi:hypothetical protein
VLTGAAPQSTVLDWRAGAPVVVPYVALTR